MEINYRGAGIREIGYLVCNIKHHLNLFLIISDNIGVETVSWSFLTIKKFPIVKIIEFFSLSLQLHLCYQLKKFLKIHYQD